MERSDRHGGNVNNLADAVLDYLWFLNFTEEEEVDLDLSVKEFDRLLDQIKNEFGEDEKAALKEAATRRLAQWLRDPDEYGYTPRSLLTLDQRYFLEDIAAGELWSMVDDGLRYGLQLSHRAALEESIQARHSNLIDSLAALGPEWGIRPGSVIADPVVRPRDLSAYVDIRGALPFAKKPTVVYQIRNASYCEDAAQYDDLLSAEFNPDELDFARLALEAFPAYVGAFQCYRAAIFSWDMVFADQPGITEQRQSTSKDVDGRDGVYRIHPVNFFDRELCKRAFGRTPEQIKKALTGQVEHVEMLHDGVHIVINSSVLPDAELLKIDSNLRRLL
jgi:hypothetical protein